MKIFNDDLNKSEIKIPLVPLREIVVFPGVVKSIFVGRNSSVEAVQLSMSSYGKKIFVVTQKSSLVETPAQDDLFSTGTVCEILEIRPGSNNTIIKVLVKGVYRAKIKKFTEKDIISPVIIAPLKGTILSDDNRSEALLNIVVQEFKRFNELKRLPKDVIKAISESATEEDLINQIVPHVISSHQLLYDLLSEEDPRKRLKILATIVKDNIEILEIEKKISVDIRKKMDKQNREYYLNEQIKGMQKELGDLNESDYYSTEEFEKKLDEIGIQGFVREKVLKEQKRLAKMQSISPEAGIVRTYLELIMELPWIKSTEDNRDLKEAKKILDSEHYSLRKVKERIIEFLAVRQLNNKTKGPILCFIGPPGTGKTSLARSVAKAIGREFVRISLGGVRDESEIRGHRRTYLGALPGKIIQSMKKSGTINPVFLLDEIDKMSSDFRGDPASALLEVLDPEQNSQFVDHYLEVPYDLSEVMFIATANSINGIPYPLRDRMEIIHISSYTEIEKVLIAHKFILQKEKIENGISEIDVKISKNTFLEIIRSYTFESGVRSLQRQIATIARKIAKSIVGDFNDLKEIEINRKNLVKYLGKKKNYEKMSERELVPGIAHGLAWSEYGGSLLPIESVLYAGTGKINLTGKLGDVMKESAQTAMSYIRSRADMFSIKYEDFHKNYDVHIHFPEGATPKDGPSGGIAITCSILSALTKVVFDADVAMTGEVTLTGTVLPIGGLKEKVLAAIRHKKKTVIIPKDNEKDMVDLSKQIREKINFVFVSRVEEVFSIAFDNSIYRDFGQNGVISVISAVNQ